MLQSPAIATHADRSKSWMHPNLRRGDLIYVSDYFTDDIYVYKVPSLALVGTLTGFVAPQGLCSDSSGNVWVTSTNTSRIIEYAHGGKTPIATLSDPGESPVNCSVNPKNGDVAVMNLCPYPDCNNGPGNAIIYPGGSGSGNTYYDPSITFYFYNGYDAAGNLFLDGRSTAGTFQFAELSEGSGAFTNITLNKSISFPGSVQWDGKHITTTPQSAKSNLIYRLKITGSTGTVIGTARLKAACGLTQTWVHGDDVASSYAGSSGSTVDLWAYPTGGNATGSGPGSNVPIGTTISVAPR